MANTRSSADVNPKRGIGDNGAPDNWARIGAIMRRTDLTAIDKCLAVGLIVEADPDGFANATTIDLMVFASVTDRETVFRAMERLREKQEIKKVSRRGQSGRYNIHIEQLNIFAESKKSGRVKADGLETEKLKEPVRFEPTTVKPVGFEPTSPKEKVSPVPPLKENTNNTQPSAAADSVSSSCEEIEGLNGATFEIMKFIASNMAVTLSEARIMLASDVQIFSADAIAAAYAKTRAEMGPGSKVTRPYKYLIEAARGIKDGQQKRHQAEPKETMRERTRRFVAEAEEKIRKGLRP